MNKIFEELAATHSRLEKEAILHRHRDDTLLQDVIRLALDPYIQFYIRKIPAYTPNPHPEATLQKVLDIVLPRLYRRDVTGNAAIKTLQYAMETLSSDDDKVIERIIKKDLRCGVSEATVNKIWPGLISTYPVMLASGYDEKLMLKIEYPAFVQVKLDGMRFNAIVQQGKVEFRSRNGKQLDLLEHLEPQFLEMAKKLSGDMQTGDVVFDGELVLKEHNTVWNRQRGNGVLSKATKGTISDKEAELVHATIWDVIPLASFKSGFCGKSYRTRFEFLESLDASADIPDRIALVTNNVVRSEQEAQTLFEQYLADGQEGIILKNITSPWEDKRVKHQIKFKGEMECDLRCVDWQEGTGKNIGKLGALVLQSHDGVIKVNVGSGFTDEHRDKYTKENTMGKIVAVRYNARINDKKTGQESLFLPIFIELRDDKDTADSSHDIK